jgi:putative two-component system response regulator
MFGAWQAAWSTAQVVLGGVGAKQGEAITRRLVREGLPEPLRVPALQELLDLCLWRPPDLLILACDPEDARHEALLQQLHTDFLARDHIPVLALLRRNDRERRRRLIQLGIRDFLSVPLDGDELTLRVRNYLEIRFMFVELLGHSGDFIERMRSRVRERDQSERAFVDHLARAGQYRDDDTGEHNGRVAELSARIADELGLSAGFVDLIWQAAPLHDVGKIGTPDSILLKPGKLTPEEMATMRQHTIIGGGILEGSASRYLQVAEVIARTHHEWWDGTGYWGLAGEDIPLEGRIVAVADVFDALTSARVYKVAWPVARAVEHMLNLRGKQFDPAVLDALMRVLQRDGVLAGDEAVVGA